jgi:hypothetical protein
VNHNIDIIQGASETGFISDITNEKPDAAVGKLLLHLPLEIFSTRVDPDTMRIMVIEKAGGERVAERSGSAGYEYGFIVEERHLLILVCIK